MVKHSFFLYGVYGKNQKCHSRFNNFIIQSEPARVRGSLCILSCGAGLLEPQGELWIPGEWVELEVPESYLPVLDSLCGYDPQSLKKSFVLRRTVPAFLANGEVLDVQVYCINGETNKDARMLETTEAQSFLAQPQSSLVDQLTERQKTYIQKLAKAKGRDIVPVDMALYRELMSLELIVDKGRRLALSKRGLELSWFL